MTSYGASGAFIDSSSSFSNDRAVSASHAPLHHRRQSLKGSHQEQLQYHRSLLDGIERIQGNDCRLTTSISASGSSSSSTPAEYSATMFTLRPTVTSRILTMELEITGNHSTNSPVEVYIRNRDDGDDDWELFASTTTIAMPNGPGSLLRQVSKQIVVQAGQAYSVYVLVQDGAKLILNSSSNKENAVIANDSRLQIQSGVGYQHQSTADFINGVNGNTDNDDSNAIASLNGRIHYAVIQDCLQLRTSTKVVLDFAITSTDNDDMLQSMDRTMEEIMSALQVLDDNLLRFAKFHGLELETIISERIIPSNHNDENGTNECPPTFDVCEHVSVTLVYLHAVSLVPGDLTAAVLQNDATIAQSVLSSHEGAHYMGQELTTGDFVITLRGVPKGQRLNPIQKRYMEQLVTRYFQQIAPPTAIWQSEVTVEVLLPDDILIVSNATITPKRSQLRGLDQQQQQQQQLLLGTTQIGMKITAQETGPGLRSAILESYDDHAEYLTELLSKELFRPSSDQQTAFFENLQGTSLMIQPLDFGNNQTQFDVISPRTRSIHPVGRFISIAGIIIGVVWLLYKLWNDCCRNARIICVPKEMDRDTSNTLESDPNRDALFANMDVDSSPAAASAASASSTRPGFYRAHSADDLTSCKENSVRNLPRRRPSFDSFIRELSTDPHSRRRPKSPNQAGLVNADLKTSPRTQGNLDTPGPTADHRNNATDGAVKRIPRRESGFGSNHQNSTTDFDSAPSMDRRIRTQRNTTRMERHEVFHSPRARRKPSVTGLEIDTGSDETSWSMPRGQLSTADLDLSAKRCDNIKQIAQRRPSGASLDRITDATSTKAMVQRQPSMEDLDSYTSLKTSKPTTARRLSGPGLDQHTNADCHWPVMQRQSSGFNFEQTNAQSAQGVHEIDRHQPSATSLDRLMATRNHRCYDVDRVDDGNFGDLQQQQISGDVQVQDARQVQDEGRCDLQETEFDDENQMSLKDELYSTASSVCATDESAAMSPLEHFLTDHDSELTSETSSFDDNFSYQSSGEEDSTKSASSGQSELSDEDTCRRASTEQGSIEDISVASSSLSEAELSKQVFPIRKTPKATIDESSDDDESTASTSLAAMGHSGDNLKESSQSLASSPMNRHSGSVLLVDDMPDDNPPPFTMNATQSHQMEKLDRNDVSSLPMSVEENADGEFTPQEELLSMKISTTNLDEGDEMKAMKSRLPIPNQARIKCCKPRVIRSGSESAASSVTSTATTSISVTLRDESPSFPTRQTAQQTSKQRGRRRTPPILPSSFQTRRVEDAYDTKRMKSKLPTSTNGTKTNSRTCSGTHENGILNFGDIAQTSSQIRGGVSIISERSRGRRRSRPGADHSARSKTSLQSSSSTGRGSSHKLKRNTLSTKTAPFVEKSRRKAPIDMLDGMSSHSRSSMQSRGSRSRNSTRKRRTSSQQSTCRSNPGRVKDGAAFRSERRARSKSPSSWIRQSAGASVQNSLQKGIQSDPMSCGPEDQKPGPVTPNYRRPKTVLNVQLTPDTSATRVDMAGRSHHSRSSRRKTPSKVSRRMLADQMREQIGSPQLS